MIARKFCQTTLALALLYVTALGVFAFARYRAGRRPDVVTVARDFHAWVRGFFPRPAPPASDPGGVPPRREPPPPGDPTGQPLIVPAGR
ncbi:MAG: hypothetical protein U1E39_16915 [Planctomycetota bacterium]